MRNVSIALLALAAGLSPVSTAQADTILFVDFSRYTENGSSTTVQTTAGTINDAGRVADLSGNNYSGFWGGGGGANNTPVVEANGGLAVDNSSSAGFVILRPNLSMPSGFAPSPTPSPFFSLNADESYTFEAVLNWNDTGSGINGIMGMTGTPEVWIRENAGNLEYRFKSSSSDFLETGDIDISGAKSSGDWHHLAVVYDATAQEIRSYLDYSLIDTFADGAIGTAGTFYTGTGDFRLGAYNTSSSVFFNGIEDRYRISEGALSPSQFMLIPEPTSVLLMAFGALALLLRRRRK